MTLLVVLLNVVLPQSLMPSEHDKKIVKLVVLARHGARTPTKYLYNNPEHWAKSYKPGQLTSIGKEQMEDLGRIIAKDYKDFLENVDTIEVRSTKVERTIESAQAAMKGIYSVIEGKNKNRFIEADIKTKALKEDYELRSHYLCGPSFPTMLRRAREAELSMPGNKVRKIIRAIKKISKKLDLSQEFFGKVSPSSFYYKCYRLADHLLADRSSPTPTPLPPNSSSTIISCYLSYLLALHSVPLPSYLTGPLLSSALFLPGDSLGGTSVHFTVLHDLSLLSLLSLLSPSTSSSIPFGAALLFEFFYDGSVELRLRDGQPNSRPAAHWHSAHAMLHNAIPHSQNTGNGPCGQENAPLTWARILGVLGVVGAVGVVVFGWRSKRKVE